VAVGFDDQAAVDVLKIRAKLLADSDDELTPHQGVSMKLTTPQIDQVARQLEARPVPEDSRMAPELQRHFGEHTFFLASTGLHFLEPVKTKETGGLERGRLVRVASWTDSHRTALTPHEPELTDVVIQLDQAA
jgi:hypothetical protein